AAHLLARYSRTPVGERTSGLPQWRLKRVLDFVEQNFHRDLSLDELSQGLGMTSHYFCRSFRKSVGVPPYRYLITRRIERAKALLASTSKDVTEIALEVGFSTPSHFTTAFRRFVGCPPSTYRNSERR